MKPAWVFIALCLLSGCVSKPRVAEEITGFPQKRPLFPGERRLEPGDRFGMFVGEAGERLESTVDEDGWLELSRIGKFKVGGLSNTEAEVVLGDACRAKGMVPLGYPPKSTLFYIVTGDVQHPGRQVYLYRLTLRRAIEDAGGLTYHVKAAQVRIWRGNGSTEQYDYTRIQDSTKADPEVLPGDAIQVNRKLKW